jgi:hypothetical protein
VCTVKLAGNHEAWALQDQSLPEAAAALIECWGVAAQRDGILAVHGSPHNPLMGHLPDERDVRDALSSPARSRAVRRRPSVHRSYARVHLMATQRGDATQAPVCGWRPCSLFALSFPSPGNVRLSVCLAILRVLVCPVTARIAQPEQASARGYAARGDARRASAAREPSRGYSRRRCGLKPDHRHIGSRA